MHGLIFETSICYWQDQPGISSFVYRRRFGAALARVLHLALAAVLSPAAPALGQNGRLLGHPR